MRNWHTLTWTWILAVLVVTVACGHGEPGTPGNHPVLWLVGGAIGLALLAGVVWFGTGFVRRWSRRAGRRE